MEQTWKEAVETLKSLIEYPETVLISDGANNWDFDNLKEALSDDDSIIDLYVDKTGITVVKPDGYLESVRFYMVIEREGVTPSDIEHEGISKIISDSPDFSITSDGFIVWESGKINGTYAELLSDMEGVWLEYLSAWDMRDIDSLKVTLDDLALIAEAQGKKLENVVDLSDLPSKPIPDDIDTSYPVWSMDTSGRCLVGETLGSIESVDEVRKAQKEEEE